MSWIGEFVYFPLPPKICGSIYYLYLWNRLMWKENLCGISNIVFSGNTRVFMDKDGLLYKIKHWREQQSEGRGTVEMSFQKPINTQGHQKTEEARKYQSHHFIPETWNLCNECYPATAWCRASDLQKCEALYNSCSNHLIHRTYYGSLKTVRIQSKFFPQPLVTYILPTILFLIFKIYMYSKTSPSQPKLT